MISLICDWEGFLERTEHSPRYAEEPTVLIRDVLNHINHLYISVRITLGRVDYRVGMPELDFQPSSSYLFMNKASRHRLGFQT